MALLKFFSKAPDVQAKPSIPLKRKKVPTDAPDEDPKRLKSSRKYNPAWASDKDLTFEKALDIWWLQKDENGMLCTLCKEHDVCDPKNGSKKWGVEPCTRYRKASVRSHKDSAMHKNAVAAEQLKRSSVFEEKLQEANREKLDIVVKAMKVVYWLAKEHVPKVKFKSLRDLISTISEDKMLQTFGHSSRKSVLELICAISEIISGRIVEEVAKSGSFGMLIDESTDIACLQQLITFIQYADEKGNQNTKFLDIRPISGSATGKVIARRTPGSACGANFVAYCPQQSTFLTRQISGCACACDREKEGLRLAFVQ